MNVSLRFDCRAYKEGTPRNNRKMIAQGEKIGASTLIEKSRVPTAALAFFVEVNNESGEPSGSGWLRFKIAPTGKYFVCQKGSGQKITFPDYSILDGQRYICNLKFNVLLGDADKKEARGCYVNVIQFLKQDADTFGQVADTFGQVADADDSIFEIKKETPKSYTGQAGADAPTQEPDLPF